MKSARVCKFEDQNAYSLFDTVGML